MKHIPHILWKLEIEQSEQLSSNKMEAMFTVSRSIIQNHTYDKILKQRFENHKKTLCKLKTTCAPDISREDSPNYAQNLQKYRSAHKTVERIFNQHTIENRSLFKRLVEIENKKQRVKSDMATSRIIHTENWHYRKEQQKRKIEKENLIIKRKIDEQKRNKLTVSKLRKQFKQHDKLFNHAKKIKI